MANPTTYLPIDEKLRLDLVTKICTQPIFVKIFIGKRLIESFTRELTGTHKIFVTYTPEANELPFASKLEAECHFSINQDMYFFKGNPTYADNTLIFNTPTVIYKIQRRENTFFTATVPTTSAAIIIIATTVSAGHFTGP